MMGKLEKLILICLIFQITTTSPFNTEKKFSKGKKTTSHPHTTKRNVKAKSTQHSKNGTYFMTRNDKVKPAEPADYSYIVSLREEGDQKHKAAGSLFFGGRWVLTTRDALADVSTVSVDGFPQLVISRAPQILVTPKYGNNLSDIQNKGYWVSEKAFCHPFLTELGEQESFTNIGIIKTDSDIPLGDEGVSLGFHSIELIDEDHWYQFRQRVKMAGWGIYDPLPKDAPLSEQLMEVTSYVSRNCTLNSDHYKPGAHICLKFETTMGLCRGDFGGPAMVLLRECPKPAYCGDYDKPYLYGVQGFNNNKGDCRKGNSFLMNVVYFRDFIDFVRRHEPPQYECKNMVNKTRSWVSSKLLDKRPGLPKKKRGKI